MTTESRPAPRLAYMPGVDGLRALAVSAVLVYHLGASWLPGGFLGVDVFLVISGYLITSLLLHEREATGRIDIARFWARRALRLLPALFLMLIVVMAAMVLLHPGEVGRLHGALLASVGYVANWYFIFADVPYFAQFGRPSVFQHLWSLAVEEQFYLIWPPVLALGLVFIGRKRLLAVVGVGLVISTALAWWMWEPFVDPSRIYYGTDTRAVGLLAGVALAFTVPAARRWHTIDGRARVTLDIIGIACFAAVIVATMTLGDLDERLYRGGFLIVALTTAGLIAVVAHPSSRLGVILGTPAMVWVGVRSYGIYLWHWPVIMLTRPDIDVSIDGPALVALRLFLIVGAAYLSYRYVERPIRRLGFHGTIAAVTAWARGLSRPVRLATASSAGLAFVGLALAVTFLPSSTPRVPGLTGVASAAIVPDYSAPGPGPSGQNADATKKKKPRVLLVGDSVMLGAAGELRKKFGSRAVIDAAVARQFPAGAAEVRKGIRALPKNATVVIHMGNNGYIPFKDFEALMKDLSSRPKVVLVTVRVPLKWQNSVNDALRYADRRYKNTVIADWYAVSGGAGLLVDGAHTTPKGARLYAKTIAAKVP